MANRLTEGPALVGDVLLDRGKLDKSIRIRLGTGGIVLTGSSEITGTGPEAVLPAQALIYDAFLNVLVASTGATKTLNVGLLSTSSGGATNGFLNGASAASTGIVRGVVTTATSGGNTGGLMQVSNTVGSFFSVFSSGSTVLGDAGFFIPKSFPLDSVKAKTVSWTPNSTDWLLFSADLYLCYVDLTK